MRNKRHTIIDDAWEMKEELMGGAEHTLRVGLIVNTVVKAMPIVIDDIFQLVTEKPTFDFKDAKECLPVLLHFHVNDVMVAILVVHDKDTNHIQCYPFSNLNDSGHWWVYEVAFDIVPGGFIEIRPVHPLVEKFDPTQGFMDHLEALATIVGSFIQRYQAGEITVKEREEDFTKLNLKRVKANREPIINDWELLYVKPAEQDPSKD